MSSSNCCAPLVVWHFARQLPYLVNQRGRLLRSVLMSGPREGCKCLCWGGAEITACLHTHIHTIMVVTNSVINSVHKSIWHYYDLEDQGGFKWLIHHVQHVVNINYVYCFRTILPNRCTIDKNRLGLPYIHTAHCWCILSFPDRPKVKCETSPRHCDVSNSNLSSSLSGSSWR